MIKRYRAVFGMRSMIYHAFLLFFTIRALSFSIISRFTMSAYDGRASAPPMVVALRQCRRAMVRRGGRRPSAQGAHDTLGDRYSYGDGGGERDFTWYG